MTSPIFAAALSVPALAMTIALARGAATPESLLHPTGEWSARLLVVALAVSPLGLLLPGARWVAWLRRERRTLGVAAFAYATLHTVLYLVDMQTLRNVLAEIGALGIWTGWVAFAIFVPLAATSTDAAVRRLGRARWSALHRFVYPAALLTLVHWIFVHDGRAAALIHFVPLLLLEVYRVVKLSLRVSRPV